MPPLRASMANTREIDEDRRDRIMVPSKKTEATAPPVVLDRGRASPLRCPHTNPDHLTSASYLLFHAVLRCCYTGATRTLHGIPRRYTRFAVEHFNHRCYSRSQLRSCGGG